MKAIEQDLGKCSQEIQKWEDSILFDFLLSLTGKRFHVKLLKINSELLYLTKKH